MSKANTPPKKSKQSKIEHYNAILIEEIRSEMKFLAEMMMSLPDQIERKFEPRFSKIECEITDIKIILNEHTKMHQEHFRRWDANDKRWEENEKRWVANDKRWEANDRKLMQLEQKLDQIDKRIDLTDCRISALDYKFDSIALKVSQNTSDILALKNT